MDESVGEIHRKCDDCGRPYWFIDLPGRTGFQCAKCHAKTVVNDEPMPEWLRRLGDRNG